MRLFQTLLGASAIVLVSHSAADAYSADVFKVCRLNPKGDNFLALRAGPGSNSRMLARLKPGTTVMDWDRRGKWFKVTVGDVNGPEGWVYSDYLCLIEDH